MSVQTKQVLKTLKSDFVPHIDISDVCKHVGNNLEQHQLTRALAAMCVTVYAHIPPEDAAKCVTDGSNDDGIDAICYSAFANRVYIIQSKCHAKIPTPAEVQTFVRGIRHLLDGDYQYMNKKLSERQNEIDGYLDDCDHIVAVFTYLSAEMPSEEALDVSKRFVDEINASGDIISFEYMRLNEIHAQRKIAQTLEGGEVDLQVEKWLTPGDYRKEIMAIVTGNQIAELYAKFGDALFDSNIRKVLQGTETNNLIFDTICEDPTSFWAYNNGITILTNGVSCSNKPRPSVSSSESFRLSSVSVVNGAQTSGALGRALKEGIPLDDIYVTVRIISTEGQDDAFGQNVTRFTNTQNTIGVREFVALDPNQEYWHQTLREEKCLYIYKMGGEFNQEEYDLSFSLEDATRALACLSGVEDATRTKSKISQMWSRINGERYKRLFPDDLDPTLMVNAVIFWRSFNDCYGQIISETEGKENKVLHEGTYLCCTLLFEMYRWDHDLSTSGLDIPAWIHDHKTLIEVLAHACFAEHEDINGGGYAGSFFKNTDKVSSLADRIRQSVFHQTELG